MSKASGIALPWMTATVESGRCSAYRFTESQRRLYTPASLPDKKTERSRIGGAVSILHRGDQRMAMAAARSSIAFALLLGALAVAPMHAFDLCFHPGLRRFCKLTVLRSAAARAYFIGAEIIDHISGPQIACRVTVIAIISETEAVWFGCEIKLRDYFAFRLLPKAETISRR